ncbi:hypothetical protein C8J57DRAFT_1520965 [Mycena rebaudengoi]|nr:hypothetical protein C8J57DRAFT_1520965 [Mycena rebaudengoi]
MPPQNFGYTRYTLPKVSNTPQFGRTPNKSKSPFLAVGVETTGSFRWPPTGPTPRDCAPSPINCPTALRPARPTAHSAPPLHNRTHQSRCLDRVALPGPTARTTRAHMRSLLICYSLHLNTTDPSAPAAPAASRRQRAPLDAHPGPTHSGSCHSACLAYRPHPLIHVASRPHWYLCAPPNASFHVRPAGITSARLYAHASGKPTTAISP